MAGVADLFTVSPSRVLLGFTTSNISNSPLISAVPLTDKTLGVHKVASSTTHNLVRPPIPIDQDEAQCAWEALYLKGRILVFPAHVRSIH